MGRPSLSPSHNVEVPESTCWLKKLDLCLEKVIQNCSDTVN